jgi:hypothetical protein
MPSRLIAVPTMSTAVSLPSIRKTFSGQASHSVEGSKKNHSEITPRVTSR